MKGKIISKKKVYQGKFFNVEEQLIEKENGTKDTYAVINRDAVVGIIPFTKNAEIYLVSEYRYLFKKNVLGAIGGHVDKNEDVLEAAKRELKEETGIVAGKWTKLAGIESSASVLNSYATLFLAEDLEFGEASPEESEDIKLVKISINDALEKVLSGEIDNSFTVIGILMLDKLIKDKKI